MTAVHPGLGRPLARWWADAAGQPYTVGYARKAFRAPGNPELTRNVRLAAFRRLIEAVGARVLKLDNVREVNAHVVVEGALGEYSVHLGSGVVHRRPGGAVCIIPVDSQRRGRIFLPFADDDPKTAEIVAKVLLLARDREIKDPTILSQPRS